MFRSELADVEQNRIGTGVVTPATVAPVGSHVAVSKTPTLYARARAIFQPSLGQHRCFHVRGTSPLATSSRGPAAAPGPGMCSQQCGSATTPTPMTWPPGPAIGT